MFNPMANKKDYRFTPHFSYAELTASAVAKQLGLENKPTTIQHYCGMSMTAHYLEYLRDKLKCAIYVNSCFRTKQVNEGVGGHANSYHMKGLAADIWTKYHTPYELVQIIKANPHPYLCVQIQQYQTFVHIEIVNFN